MMTARARGVASVHLESVASVVVVAEGVMLVKVVAGVAAAEGVVLVEVEAEVTAR